MGARQESVLQLRSAGAALVMEISDNGPLILHWGGELADEDLAALAATAVPSVTHSSFDEPRAVPALPTQRDGWSGAAGIEWHRAGLHAHPDVRLANVHRPDEQTVLVELVDSAAQAAVGLKYRMHSGGVLSASLAVTSTAPEDSAPLDLVAARLLVPLPERAAELLDFTGRWSEERRPQRLPVTDGTHLRAGRRGRPGHDSPFVTMVGTPGFGFRSGEVWASHVAWSGDQESRVERLPEGVGVLSALLGGGELLGSGEVRLGPGETYRSAEVLFAWGEEGIDSVSDRFHRYARSLPAHPSGPRPLVLNTWEAVYFDHDPEKLAQLARAAAAVGVERFVLDDGWFGRRDDDTTSLGDWTVDRRKWPDGIRGLAELVHSLGMQFGIWFEPEMVSADSDTARAHPEWILGPANAAEWRHQLVLDLSQPAARQHILDQMDAVVRDLSIDFIKWDHNRDLHRPVSSATGRASGRAQVLAVYALMDELRARHPSLEIESCASGGARVDLGVLSHAQRVWASDTNDPLERQLIQRWTGVLLPPELVGSHVGPQEAHVTHRASHLALRLATALFGHAGIEWDITACRDEELAQLRRWAELYRELRPLLHHGITVRSDETGTDAVLHGVVSEDRDRGVFALVQLTPQPAGFSPRRRFPGLDPDRRYRVRLRQELGRPSAHQVSDPAWLAQPERIVSGRLLGSVGVPLPLLNPGNALVVELVAG